MAAKVNQVFEKILPPYDGLPKENGPLLTKLRKWSSYCVEHNISNSAFIFHTGITNQRALFHMREYVRGLLQENPNYNCETFRAPSQPLFITYDHNTGFDIESGDGYNDRRSFYEKNICDHFVNRSYAQNSFLGLMIYQCDYKIIIPVISDRYSDMTEYDVNFVIPKEYTTDSEDLFFFSVAKPYFGEKEEDEEDDDDDDDYDYEYDYDKYWYRYKEKHHDVDEDGDDNGDDDDDEDEKEKLYLKNPYYTKDLEWGIYPETDEKGVLHIDIPVFYYTTILDSELYGSMKEHMAELYIKQEFNGIYEKFDCGYIYEENGYPVMEHSPWSSEKVEIMALVKSESSRGLMHKNVGFDSADPVQEKYVSRIGSNITIDLTIDL